jgi:hypothetical protein
MMHEFWEAYKNWTPFGQGAFFVLLAWCVVEVFRSLFHYIAVMFHGWPPNDYEEPEEE